MTTTPKIQPKPRPRPATPDSTQGEPAVAVSDEVQPELEQPELGEPEKAGPEQEDGPVVDETPALYRVLGPRPLKVGEKILQPGDPVPGAEKWPRVETWVRAGRIERIPEVANV